MAGLMSFISRQARSAGFRTAKVTSEASPSVVTQDKEVDLGLTLGTSSPATNGKPGGPTYSRGEAPAKSNSQARSEVIEHFNNLAPHPDTVILNHMESTGRLELFTFVTEPHLKSSFAGVATLGGFPATVTKGTLLLDSPNGVSVRVDHEACAGAEPEVVPLSTFFKKFNSRSWSCENRRCAANIYICTPGQSLEDIQGMIARGEQRSLESFRQEHAWRCEEASAKWQMLANKSSARGRQDESPRRVPRKAKHARGRSRSLATRQAGLEAATPPLHPSTSRHDSGRQNEESIVAPAGLGSQSAALGNPTEKNSLPTPRSTPQEQAPPPKRTRGRPPKRRTPEISTGALEAPEIRHGLDAQPRKRVAIRRKDRLAGVPGMTRLQSPGGAKGGSQHHDEGFHTTSLGDGGMDAPERAMTLRQPADRIVTGSAPNTGGDDFSPQQFLELETEVQQMYLKERRNMEIIAHMNRNCDILAQMVGMLD